MSFFSRDLYQDVARNWRGVCFTYLLIVLALNLIPDMVRLQTRITDFITDEAPQVVRQVPTITIAGGTASINEHTPYTINAPWSKLPFAVIDTSDRPAQQAGPNAVITLTKTRLTVKGDGTDLHSIDLSRIHNLVIDQKLIFRWMDAFKSYFIFAVYFFALVFAFLYYLIQVLLCASLGMLFAKIFNVELATRSVIRLSVVAFTPPLVLQTVHSLLDIEFPYGSVITLVLATCYLFFAVGACSEKTVSKIA